MDVIRQGDLLLIPANKNEGEKQSPGEHGHTLIEGEATFHHHILDKGVFHKLKQELEDGLIGTIEIPKEGANLVHLNVQTRELTKEHEIIPLDPQILKTDKMEVIRQFEYWPEGYKKIAD